MCVCLCVGGWRVFSSTSVPPKARGFVFIPSWEARWTCILIHFTIHTSKAATICIPTHSSVPQRLTGSVFLFFLLLYTSKASDGWISHCSGVNLSCMKLSVLKEAIGCAEEAVCTAVVGGDSLWCQRDQSHQLLSFHKQIMKDFTSVDPHILMAVYWHCESKVSPQGDLSSWLDLSRNHWKYIKIKL